MALSPEALDLIQQLNSLSKSNSDYAPLQAEELSRKLTLAVKPPGKIATDTAYGVFLPMSARIGVDLGIFRKIASASSKKPVTVDELVESSGCEKVLLVRFLRILACADFIKEEGVGLFSPTPLTHTMTLPTQEANHRHMWDMSTGTLAKMPYFLAETNWRNPTDGRKGALQYAFDTPLNCFEYWGQRQNWFDDFNTAMTGNRNNNPLYLDWFPVQERILDGFDPSKGPLFVDVGGGYGHDLTAFNKKFPNKGKLILEDLPQCLADVKNLDPAIEKLELDFFNPQPIKGAKVYYFHFCMHDFPDEFCIKVLKNTVAAMTPGYSKLLLNEMILADEGALYRHATMDLNMLSLTSGLERTKSQWEYLLRESGLTLVKFWSPPNEGEGIVEAYVAETNGFNGAHEANGANGVNGTNGTNGTA